MGFNEIYWDLMGSLMGSLMGFHGISWYLTNHMGIDRLFWGYPLVIRYMASRDIPELDGDKPFLMVGCQNLEKKGEPWGKNNQSHNF